MSGGFAANGGGSLTPAEQVAPAAPPAEQVAPAAPPAEPSYLITFVIQKVGDRRTLEVQNSSVTVAMCAENPIIPKLIKAHMNALAQHDAGQLTETTREAEGLLRRQNGNLRNGW